MTTRADELLDFADDLPSLPAAVVEALRLLGDETTDNDQIASALSTDQGLVAQLLKLANSAYYGVSRRVSTVRQALLVLGRKSVRSLVIAAGAKDHLSASQDGYLLDPGTLWHHSMAVGQAATMVAGAVGYRPAEEAFVAGLLHDIGKVVLSTYLAEVDDELQDRLAAGEAVSFTDLEQEFLEVDHAALGGLVAEHWQLPSHLSHAIQFHHRPSEAGDDWQLATIIHVANAIVLTLGIGLGRDGLQQELDYESIRQLGLSDEQLLSLTEKVAEAVHDAANEPV